MTSWSSIVKTATGTSGAIVLEMDENEVEESVAVAVVVAVVVAVGIAVVDVARWLGVSDGIGIVVEQWDECGEASSIRACRVRLASRSGLGCMVVVGGAGGGDGAGEAEGAGDVDGAGGGADSGGSVGREEVGSCDSRVIVNIVHVPIQSNPIQKIKNTGELSVPTRQKSNTHTPSRSLILSSHSSTYPPSSSNLLRIIKDLLQNRTIVLQRIHHPRGTDEWSWWHWHHRRHRHPRLRNHRYGCRLVSR